MNKSIFRFICLLLIEQTILQNVPNSAKKVFYLPMKKDHKYGDDICYYREEIDEKHDYTIYYVKPCEKGKYCENEVDNQPFGFCRDIPTNATDFPTYEGDCNSNGECLKDLDCDNGKCKKITKVCPSADVSHPDFPFFDTLGSFTCHGYNDKTTDDTKSCKKYDPQFSNTNPKYYTGSDITYGKYPGLPKVCGITRYTSITDNYDVTTSTGTVQKSYERWIKESEDWCTIGEAEDGDFVVNEIYCKSGFTLEFYPNKDLIDPSNSDAGYSQSRLKMCVTPIKIDKSNPEVGTVVTYKIKDGNEQKYNYDKYYTSTALDDETVLKSQLYKEFSEEFQNASDEDKKNCYRLPQNIAENCQNIKLLKLYYFHEKINEYLFYKDTKDLEKVLHFKIQRLYHRYYDLSNYLNLNYLFLLLIIILL